jgi:uncharacterized protein
MMSTQASFVWYELMTADVAAAKAFYGKVVGWTTQDVPMPDMTYTLLSVKDTQVGGMMALPQKGLKPAWVGYIGVDDVDGAAAKLQELGGKIHMPPSDIPNVGRFAVVADGQGAMFNLFKQANPGQPVVSDAPGHTGWRELHTTDWPKAFALYSAMFGWAKGDCVDMGPLGKYQLFTINGQPAGGMFNSPAAGAGSFWLYYFHVDDIDAATKRVADAGGNILQGAQQVPGGSWIIQAADPQGASFALVGPRKQ